MRAIIALAVLLAAGTAHAAEINAFVSTAIKAATDELLPPFERANGHTIRASYAPSGALLPRFERRRAGRCVPDRRAGARPAHQAGQDRRRPHRPLPHRHRHRRAQGRAEARRVDARGAEARAARGQGGGPRLARRRQHHRRPHHADVREARHRRPDHAEDQALRWAARTAASACSCRAAKPRSACSRSRSCWTIPTSR